MDLSGVSNASLAKTFKRFNRFMLLLWRLGLGSWGNGTKHGGYVMVIKHKGRRTGMLRYTPVNYATIDEDIFCVAALGEKADWYRNLIAEPEVEVWLANGRWSGAAEDVSNCDERVDLIRAVLIASGFAAPLFGVNPNKLTDTELADLCENYRLIKIRKTAPVTGPGGPGDLAWIWPLSTFLLLWLVLRRRRRSVGQSVSQGDP
jgi:deazaflavin-dependent oxidoreductase (nitroreductase family)